MSYEVTDPVLTDKLVAIRENPARIGEFQSWFALNQHAYERSLPEGLMLKLKRGDSEQVMTTIARLLPACKGCSSLFPEGGFRSLQELSQCNSTIGLAVSDGVLTRLPAPDWLKPDAAQHGADAYFACLKCGSIWTLVQPEREGRGFWARLA